jgi:hypothetical protein
VFTHMSS